MTATQNAAHEQPKTASESAVRRYATVNPFTGETEKSFDFTPTEEIDGIIGRAHAAYQEWRQRPVQERAGVIRRAAELMDERRVELSRLITTEMGKRQEEATGELYLCSMILKYYADNGAGFIEPTSVQPLMGKGEALIETQPIGVLLAIEPWNYPFYLVVRVAGPNLVLGNTVILKHAEITPQCAVAIQRLFTDAGAPEGVTNTFLRIIADPRIQGVTLTGSERAGSAVGALAGKHVKKSVLELGGSDPFIVLDADDLGATVKAAAMGRMQNTGQACTASKRLIVIEEHYEPFVEGLKQAFSTFSPGDRPPLRRRWPRCRASGRRRTCTPRSRTPSTRAPPSSPAADGPTTRARSSRRRSSPTSRPRCRPTARSCSVPRLSSTRSRTATRRPRWPTTATTAWAPPS